MPSVKYGRLTVLGAAPPVGDRPAMRCRCDCGAVVSVQRKRLLSSHTQSCGCLQRERGAENIAAGQEAGRTHGLSGMHAWRAWMGMRSRVHQPSTSDFARYGGRGIRVCPEWDGSFEAFLLDVGHPPSPKHTLDRIDSNGDYAPGNVRWATSQEQNRNKSDNVMVPWKGRTVTLVEAAEDAGIPYHTAWWRIQRAKWSPERALTHPVRA